MNNFDLAPPVKTVDGLNAVPIDISHINASLTFDASTEIASADVTFDFSLGPDGGQPIFDLRQTITEAWLDGVSFPPGQIGHHDFGGGANAELRILESVLTAHSTHTLRLRYALGTPQAPLPSGRYLPQLSWSSGPRLVFNFGFTDLSPGRYLESWLPANLIFDQFQLDLEIQILNTTVSHTPITNGTVTSLGTNNWSITFPDSFTALSSLFELRASNTLTSLTDTVLLPISGKTVTIEIWKLTSNTANLIPLMSNVKTFLSDNENNYGAYLHDNRFIIFLISGGMEYDGGTTTGTGALKHETFHSWFGRGVKPASQNDGWWDEAWTRYNMFGASSSVPFNFSDTPIRLYTQNPYSRVTADGSYTNGKRVFDGLASLIGISNLKTILSEFYQNYNSRPATTQQLEELLLCRSGNASIVDAFYRFVYGFGNPSSTPDLWLKDDPAHGGSDYWSGRFWDSPDLWVRNQDDNGTTHQPPEFGQDNWFYARVHNRSTSATADHFIVVFNVKTFAGTQFQYPNDFLPCVAAASGFDMGPRDTTIIKAKWPKALVPPAETHACLLASVHTRFEHPSSGAHVWEHNNLAQKNLTIVNLDAGDWIVVPFEITNFEIRPRQKFWLEIVQDSKSNLVPFSLMNADGIVINSRYIEKTNKVKLRTENVGQEPVECGSNLLFEKKEDNLKKLGFWTSKNPNLISEHFNDYNIQKFEAKHLTKIPILLKNKNEQNLMGIKVEVPKDATPGEVIKIDIVKRKKPSCFLRKNLTLGGIAIQIRVSE